MKNKGFTLAEILGVVVIIGMLLILVMPVVIDRITSSSEDAGSAEEDIIFDAADQYIREHPNEYPSGKSGRYCIPIQTLIDDGKLTEPVTDVTTGEDLSDKSVMVTIYTAGTSDYEIREGDECEALASLPMIDFDVTPKGSSWVQSRTVIIIWPAIDGDYEARYRIDGGEWIYVDIDSHEGGETELVFDESSESTSLEAQYVGSSSTTSNIISSKINIVNIDSEPPTCSLRLSGTMGDNNWYRSNVTIDFGDNNSNLDDDLSGVEDYGISTSSSNTFGGISSLRQTSDTAGVTYYGYVVDKAGNIGKCSVTFKKDATKPTCTMTERGTKGNNDWYRSDVVFTVTNSDAMSGVASYGMNNSSTVKYNSLTTMTLSSDTKSVTYYGFVKDAAGNTNTCSRTVKRDTTAPTCTTSKSNTYTTSGVTVKYTCSDSTSGTVSCPSTKTGLKSSVSAITIQDKAGNTGTCKAVTISKQTQYRKRTRSAASCTSSCCGTTSYTYACGTTCSRYRCSYQLYFTGGSTQIRWEERSSCPSSSPNYGADTGLGADYQYNKLISSTCISYSTTYCTGYKNKTCTSASCCGYTSWSSYGSWGTGNYCNSNTCQSQSRVVYY